MTMYEAKRRLRVARDAFHEHAFDCVRWDYEGDGDCPECQRTREDLEKAHERVRRMKEAASCRA